MEAEKQEDGKFRVYTTERVQGQPVQHIESLSQNRKKRTKGGRLRVLVWLVQ